MVNLLGIMSHLPHTNIFYLPGSTCSWSIHTGGAQVTLALNYSLLAPGDVLVVQGGSGGWSRLEVVGVGWGDVRALGLTPPCAASGCGCACPCLAWCCSGDPELFLRRLLLCMSSMCPAFARP